MHVLFGKDLFLRAFDLMDMERRLKRDGDIAALLNAFVAAATATMRGT
jgi:hypothetical protein